MLSRCALQRCRYCCVVNMSNDHDKLALLCSIHVASVVQMTHMLLTHGGLMKSKAVSITQRFATYWSAVVHDYEHGGMNNDFLIKTSNPLAVLYNDQSPLENHHVSASSRLVYAPEYRFMAVRVRCCA